MRFMVMGVLALVLAGCSGGDAGAPAAGNPAGALDAQVQAMEKAKEVNQVIQDAARAGQQRADAEQ